jgi:glycosyltransferase involved in cell wall biosynthesis
VTFVEAAARVRAERPDAWFVAAGAGPTEGAVRARVAQLGLTDHVLLPGFVEDVPALLGALDLFVLSSYLEGLGTSVLDAQAAGVPVVATRVGGVPEMIDDPDNGRLVPARDPGALAAAILAALADPAESARRAARGQVTVRAFDLAETVAATERLYRELLAERA